MNEIQQAAFASANSGAAASAPQTLSALIVGLLATLVMLWCCWVWTGAYRASARSGAGAVGSQALRALFITVVVLAITQV